MKNGMPEKSKMDGGLCVNSRTLIDSAERGELVYLNSFYIQKTGLEKVRYRGIETRSDLADSMKRSFSADNGRTWSEWEPVAFMTQTPKGTVRQSRQPGFVDPENGLLLTMVIKGLLPTDDAMEGIKNYYLSYEVSADGGRSSLVDEQVIQQGNYTSEHPCEGVWVGKNSFFIGDICCRPIRTRSGRILIPVQTSPVGPDGEYINPGGGLSYHEAAVLIGTWRDQERITWDLSRRVVNDPRKSTRGCIEPTLAELPDGRILMVLRGSNGGEKDPEYKIPGYRWYSMSSDGGYTWSPVQPWTYTDGSLFFSPSSCSQLLRHSNGHYYWMGNITPENPRGSLPRYPFVIGQVDSKSGLLIRDSVITVDERRAEDSATLQLSNFMADEDRETKEILIHMSRARAGTGADYFGDAYLYRIGVGRE